MLLKSPPLVHVEVRLSGVGASVGAGIFVITGVVAQPTGPAVCGWLAVMGRWEFVENDHWIGASNVVYCCLIHNDPF